MQLKRFYCAKFKSLLFFSAMFVSITYSASALSWYSVGHRIVAAIAYDHLTPQAKRKINDLTHGMFYSKHAESRFLRAATWPDKLKAQDVTAFNRWHYINIPYVKDNVYAPQPPLTSNVPWAIQQSIKVLSSPKASYREKAMFLSFLVHFVGDIHQPLHCASLYSKRFPNGDGGGNLFVIRSFYANNLHTFWDEMAGLYAGKRYMSNRKVEQAASGIEQQYPMSYFGKRIDNLGPWSWSRRSYALAKQYAYNGLQLNDRLSEGYITTAQSIVRQQVALAGYRLARVLNGVF